MGFAFFFWMLLLFWLLLLSEGAGGVLSFAADLPPLLVYIYVCVCFIIVPSNV